MNVHASASYRDDQQFFVRLAIAIFIFVVFAFGQWALRGYANYTAAPVAVHLHGVVMLGWLALFIVQNQLAASGSLALHRKLGWLGLALAILIAILGTFVTVEAVRLHRVPPIFTDPYFLVLGPVHTYFFLATLIGAIALRRQTDWHRRLMLVATVLVMEPAFGRLVPFPVLASPWGPWAELLLQLAVVGIVMLHDRRVRGAVHPALWWGAGIIVLAVASVVVLARMPVIVSLASAYAGN